jgi:hypothetical protein
LAEDLFNIERPMRAVQPYNARQQAQASGSAGLKRSNQHQ